MLAKAVFFLGSLRGDSKINISLHLELNLVPKLSTLMTKKLNYSFGILLDKNHSSLLLVLTTRDLLVLYWSSICLRRAVSRM